jgi:hypothetical protein
MSAALRREEPSGVRAPEPSARKKLAFGLVLLSLCVAAVVAGAETFARLKGFKPWTPSRDQPMRVWPGGSLGRPHPSLGSAYLPGRFVVTLADGYSFRVTHGESGLRITRPLGVRRPRLQEPALDLRLLLYPWLVTQRRRDLPLVGAERLPDYEVLNFGVGGYGTLHSFLQFRKRSAARARVAVIAYGSFHDARNTLNRYRMKGITLTAGWAACGCPARASAATAVSRSSRSRPTIIVPGRSEPAGLRALP